MAYFRGTFQPWPYGVLAWVIIGLTIGLLAGLLYRGARGGRFGVIGDMVYGLIGAFVGGAPVGFATRVAEGVIGSGLTAFVGACLAVAVGRVVIGGRARVP